MALGGEKEAVAWLSGKGVSGRLEVIEWKPEDEDSGWLFSRSVANAVGEMIGLPGAGGHVLRESGADRLFLDGLVSVWHP